MWETLGRIFAEGFVIPDIIAQGRIDLDPAIAEMIRTTGASWPPPPIRAIGSWRPPRCNRSEAGARASINGSEILSSRSMCGNCASRFIPAVSGPSRRTRDARLRHVRKGGVLATMADLRDRNGVMVPFFGRMAPTSTFPALIARMTDAPLYAAEIVRKPGVRFRISLRKIDVPETEDRNADILAATEALHAAFEDFIRRNPEHWMWAHRRWG